MNTCFAVRTDTRSREGFALLVTIALVAFLVLILMMFASLTRVETSVAANTQKVSMARQNALMALNIAVGQLQQHAGPDDRITATSALLGETTNPHIAGVWSAGGTNREPDVWLVSGGEGGAAAATVFNSLGDPSADITTGNAADVFLVGDHSVSAKAARIKVPKQVIRAPAGGVPGLGSTATPTIGHYAWWVGDQGVKASLGLPDRHEEVTYGAWTGAEARGRIRQQIGSGANYFRGVGAGGFGFDPLDAGNRTMVKNISSPGQMELLDGIGGSSLSGYVRDHFHDFTEAGYSVLANTEPASSSHRGLLRDLSARPAELGDAFASYTDFGSYLEAPVAGKIYRRHYMRAYRKAAAVDSDLPEIGFGVAPVISDFLLRFRVSRFDDDSVVVRAKMFVSLWNPYTSALVPEDLYLEVSGLPEITMTDSQNNGLTATFNLQDPGTVPVTVLKNDGQGTMRVRLRFTQAVPNGSTQDKTSWLPGRVYGWATASNNASTLQFYTQDSEATSGTGWSYRGVPQLSGGTAGIIVDAPEVTGLKVRLLNSAGEVLAEHMGLDYPSFSAGVNSDGWKFGYGFRINQPHTLTTSRDWRMATADLRARPVERGQHIPFDYSAGEIPTAYNQSVDPATLNDYLVYRPMTGSGATNTGHDVPLFELPRQPILSVGELQHLILPGARMFSIGNPWGGDVKSRDVNALFDRFFFSGLTPGAAGPDLAAGEPLPNWNLRVSGTDDIATVRNDGEGSGYSSAHLLQGGGFNLNSTSTAAWRAMLSRTRFDASSPFSYVDTQGSGGGPGGSATDRLDRDATLGAGSAAPVFTRFPQSAQETYDWRETGGRQLSTQAFRQGIRGGDDEVSAPVRGLSTDQIETLAARIVELVKLKGDTDGPFRSVAGFLNASSLFGNAGLLEKAIADSGINPPELTPDETVSSVDAPGFSSLTLTPADIMVALAPYLKTRSDTFVVRTFGDSVNPVTGDIEGRAYLEAVVQRLPEPFDQADLADISTRARPGGAFGRRFQVTSFRWLNESDI